MILPVLGRVSLVLLALALWLPSSAAASPHQFSILQDDANLLGLTYRNPDAAMAEAKYLGVDMVRAFVTWSFAAPSPNSRTKPKGFDPGNHRSGYNWGLYDAFVARARRHGLKVFLTLAPPIPRWASEEPSVCPHFTGGYRNLGKSCHWKPSPRAFGQFAKAVATRYRRSGRFGGVDLYSIYNEPNLEQYLYPQGRGPRAGRGPVDLGARRYRALWLAGWRSIATYDPSMRGKVLFGETSAISAPLDHLYAALCLDDRGRPFRGRLRRLQGCPARPRRLPIGGVAIHPYAPSAAGSVFARSKTTDSLTMGYLPRLHRLMRRAVQARRIPAGRGIYVTEFGFQSKPPDSRRGLRPKAQARALNEAERLFAKDRRVRSFAQFELFDVPEGKGNDVFNTGLRYGNERFKPSWRAFRMPLTVSRLSRRAVEVWGQVRPAKGPVRLTLTRVGQAGGPVGIARPRTNSSGYFRLVIRRRGARRMRFQTRWRAPSGQLMTSRVATAGRRIQYLE